MKHLCILSVVYDACVGPGKAFCLCICGYMDDITLQHFPQLWKSWKWIMFSSPGRVMEAN